VSSKINKIEVKDFFEVQWIKDSLQFEFCSPPVSSLGVVSDLVASFHPCPLWDRSVLFHLFSQMQLDFEGFVRPHDSDLF